MAKIRKTNIYPLVLPSTLDRLIITDVSDYNRTRSIRVLDLLEFLNPNGNSLLIDRIFSGSIFWIQELQHRSTVITYSIGSQMFAAPITDITLSDAHPTLDRIDVFVVTTDSEVLVVEGTPAENPQEPTIIFTKQLKVCIAYIPAASNQPQLSGRELVYDENAQEPTEWNSSIGAQTAASNVVLDETNNPDLNSYHISVKGIKQTATEKTEFYFIKEENTPISNLSSLYFRLNSLTTLDFMITIKLVKDGNNIGYISFPSGNFGFDVSQNNQYRDVNIPIEFFQVTDTEFDRIDFLITQVSGESEVVFLIDNINLIYGGENPTTLQTFLSLLDVADDSYTGKKGYFASVNKTETEMELIPKLFHEIEGGMVKKGNGNEDFKNIESGDAVWFKEVEDVDSQTIFLMGDVYDPSNVGGLNKESASSYKKIYNLNI